MNLGNRINALRKEKKISVDELSEMSGVPKGTLSKITAGITSNPTLDTVQAICRALGCSLDALDDTPHIASPALSSEAVRIAEDYDALPSEGKQMVRLVVDQEKRRAAGLPAPSEERKGVS